MTKEEFYAAAADAFLSWQFRGKPEQASGQDESDAFEAVTAVLDRLGAWETREAAGHTRDALAEYLAGFSDDPETLGTEPLTSLTLLTAALAIAEKRS